MYEDDGKYIIFFRTRGTHCVPLWVGNCNLSHNRLPFRLAPFIYHMSLSMTVDSQLHPSNIHKTTGCSSLTLSFSSHVSKPYIHTHNVHPYASMAVPHTEPLAVSLENRGKSWSWDPSSGFCLLSGEMSTSILQYPESEELSDSNVS